MDLYVFLSVFVFNLLCVLAGVIDLPGMRPGSLSRLQMAGQAGTSVITRSGAIWLSLIWVIGVRVFKLNIAEWFIVIPTATLILSILKMTKVDRAQLAFAFGKIDQVELGLSALKDSPQENVRVAFTGLLGLSGDPRAIHGLQEALNDASQSVRNAASEALRKMGTPDSAKLPKGDEQIDRLCSDLAEYNDILEKLESGLRSGVERRTLTQLVEDLVSRDLGMMILPVDLYKIANTNDLRRLNTELVKINMAAQDALSNLKEDESYPPGIQFLLGNIVQNTKAVLAGIVRRELNPERTSKIRPRGDSFREILVFGDDTTSISDFEQAEQTLGKSIVSEYQQYCQNTRLRSFKHPLSDLDDRGGKASETLALSLLLQTGFKPPFDNYQTEYRRIDGYNFVVIFLG